VPPSPDNPSHNPVHTFTTSEHDERRRATKRPASRAPKLRHDKPVVRPRRTRSDESRRRSVRHTSVCTPARARRVPGHEPRVAKVTRSMCPSPRKASYAPVRECPTQPKQRTNPTRVNDRGRRTHQTGGGPWRPTDTSVCTPLARSACSGLVTPFTCPSRRPTGCALGKLVRSSSQTRRPAGNRQYEYAPAYSEGPAIPTDYRG